MVQIITYDADSGLREGISGAASALASSLRKKNERLYEKKQLEEERQGLDSFKDQSLSPETAYHQALKNRANPEQAKSLYQAARQRAVDNASKSAMDQVLSSGHAFNSQEGQQLFLQSYMQANGPVQEVMKMFSPSSKQQRQQPSIIEKKVQEDMATNILDTVKGGSKMVRAEKDLDWLESNIPNVGKMKLLSNFGPFKNSIFAEFENRGNLALDPVIHTFNRTGVVPKAKLDWMKETFAIKPNDTQPQIKGKINALRSLSHGARQFEENMQGLIDKYGIDIPVSEYIKTAKSTDSFLDDFEKKYNYGNLPTSQSNTVFEKLPSPTSVPPGTKIKDTKTGNILISNGAKWIKQKG